MQDTFSPSKHAKPAGQDSQTVLEVVEQSEVS
jgi:hypothetical protein